MQPSVPVVNKPIGGLAEEMLERISKASERLHRINVSLRGTMPATEPEMKGNEPCLKTTLETALRRQQDVELELQELEGILGI